jgi:hypothetical protein
MCAALAVLSSCAIQTELVVLLLCIALQEELHRDPQHWRSGGSVQQGLHHARYFAVLDVPAGECLHVQSAPSCQHDAKLASD